MNEPIAPQRVHLLRYSQFIYLWIARSRISRPAPDCYLEALGVGSSEGFPLLNVLPCVYVAYAIEPNFITPSKAWSIELARVLLCIPM